MNALSGKLAQARDAILKLQEATLQAERESGGSRRSHTDELRLTLMRGSVRRMLLECEEASSFLVQAKSSATSECSSPQAVPPAGSAGNIFSKSPSKLPELENNPLAVHPRNITPYPSRRGSVASEQSEASPKKDLFVELIEVLQEQEGSGLILEARGREEKEGDLKEGKQEGEVNAVKGDPTELTHNSLERLSPEEHRATAETQHMCCIMF